MLDIRKLTPDGWAKLKKKDGGEFRIAVVSDSAFDMYSVKGFIKSAIAWVPFSWSNIGSGASVYNIHDLFLPPQPVTAPITPVFIALDQPNARYATASSTNCAYVRDTITRPQAVIRITNWSEVNVGDGLEPGSEPAFKLVRVEGK